MSSSRTQAGDSGSDQRYGRRSGEGITRALWAMYLVALLFAGASRSLGGTAVIMAHIMVAVSGLLLVAALGVRGQIASMATAVLMGLLVAYIAVDPVNALENVAEPVQSGPLRVRF